MTPSNQITNTLPPATAELDNVPQVVNNRHGDQTIFCPTGAKFAMGAGIESPMLSAYTDQVLGGWVSPARARADLAILAEEVPAHIVRWQIARAFGQVAR